MKIVGFLLVVAVVLVSVTVFADSPPANTIPIIADRQYIRVSTGSTATSTHRHNPGPLPPCNTKTKQPLTVGLRGCCISALPVLHGIKKGVVFI